ncbi:MAG TPA: cytochrome c oxidase subunit 3 [Gammaproteobacteria bacterium]|nr:cytochrome c oxidase subunit 3 [Gammaproteobacteria bacterium]
MEIKEQKTSKYFVPEPSVWPIILILGLVTTAVGGANWLEGRDSVGEPILAIGGMIVIAMAFTWFRGVIHESRSGFYNQQVDRAYRLAMAWFIFSEVAFFGAFFGTLFYSRDASVFWLSGHGSKALTGAVLWPHFKYAWPTNGPEHLGGAFKAANPWGIAAINTGLLLSSSVTITWAHWALKGGRKWQSVLGTLITLILGCTFLRMQAKEYLDSYLVHHLTLHSGIYGSTFFVMTGFHGLHVTLGSIMLMVILGRLIAGHFLGRNDSHFGFEAVSWYWHFVDVVWLCLFVFVYVL